MTWIWLRKENLMSEIEFFNCSTNSIRTNYFKAKIDKSKNNCSVCGDRDENAVNWPKTYTNVNITGWKR